MDLATRKIAFVQKFLRLHDNRSIARLEELLTSELEEIEPMSLEQFNQEIDHSLEDSKNGNLIHVNDLKEHGFRNILDNFSRSKTQRYFRLLRNLD